MPAIFDHNLLSDWCDYCEGKKKFDSFHFSTLLMESFLDGYTPQLDQFIQEITKYFDSSVYQHLKYAFSEPIKAHDDIMYWVEKDLLEKQKIFANHPLASGLNEIIEKKSFRLIQNHTEIDKARITDNHTILYEMTGDFVTQNIADERLFALDEILYNIAYDYNLVYGVLSGCLNSEIDLSNYLEIYQRNCDYAVNDETIIILTPP